MKEEHAFTSEVFPCNAKPFLKRMRELLDEAETNSIEYLTNYPEKYYAFRACLLIINQMTFGQLSTIDLMDEWKELNELLKEEKF